MQFRIIHPTPGLVPKAIKKEIFTNRETRDQMTLLVNNRNSLLAGFVGVRKAHRLSKEIYTSFIRLVHPGENLDQC